MQFISTPLQSAFLINPDKREDARGFFSRVFCEKEFQTAGLETRFVQCNHSFNLKQGTLRGLHYQTIPREEVKLVRCIQGAVFDVIVDMRQESGTFLHWFGTELTAEKPAMMYVPKGFAHGYMTLAPNTEILYFVTEFYSPEYEKGVRWNDPAISIDWPMEPAEISSKDQYIPWIGS